jgi:uncharacterized protein involved in exopolysaccharide biosynthesis
MAILFAIALTAAICLGIFAWLVRRMFDYKG